MHIGDYEDINFFSIYEEYLFPVIFFLGCKFVFLTNHE